jgi:hypothetical protein
MYTIPYPSDKAGNGVRINGFLYMPRDDTRPPFQLIYPRLVYKACPKVTMLYWQESKTCTIKREIFKGENEFRCLTPRTLGMFPLTYSETSEQRTH